MRLAALALGLTLAVAPLGTYAVAQRPDTTILRPRAGGTWRTPRTAPELLVVEGTAPGREFGELMDALALSDGRVAVFDGRGVNGPELLLLNAEGERMRQLGRVGTGPGEYGPSVTPGSIAEGPEGEIWVLDRRSQRIVRWARDGGVLPAVALTVSIEPSNDAPLLAGQSQSIFAPATGGDGTSSWQGYLRFALTGQLLDSLATPMIAGNPPLPSPFWPQWLMHPMRDGRMSSRASDGAALFLTDAKAGRVVRIEVPVRGTPFLPRERAEWQALLEFEATKMSLSVPRLPATEAGLRAHPGRRQRHTALAAAAGAGQARTAGAATLARRRCTGALLRRAAGVQRGRCRRHVLGRARVRATRHRPHLVRRRRRVGNCAGEEWCERAGEVGSAARSAGGAPAPRAPRATRPSIGGASESRAMNIFPVGFLVCVSAPAGGSWPTASCSCV
ncbi:MAG: hypothetical protein IPP98_11905 [Gemmatimonadetes bacterium]|nr:hypothetical protein [Gemmatimonadota bacterium]